METLHGLMPCLMMLGTQKTSFLRLILLLFLLHGVVSVFVVFQPDTFTAMVLLMSMWKRCSNFLIFCNMKKYIYINIYIYVFDMCVCILSVCLFLSFCFKCSDSIQSLD